MPFRLRGSVTAGPLLAGVFALGVLAGCSSQPSEDLGQADASIIGGKLDTTDKGVVSLLKQAKGGYYPACSGTLLTQNLVLTAHHCVAALSSADGENVQCGTTKFQDTERASSMLISIEANVGMDKLQPFKVSDVWVPEEGGDVCGKDVALLLLSGSGVPASAATPIAPGVTKALAANEVFAAIGYGLQDPTDTTGQTVGHRMSVLNAKVFCQGTACGTDMVKDGEFIADSPVCSGDSGGPALSADGHVSGVTSRGDQKCTVGIYSSVYAWRDFVAAKALVAAQSGHYTPPDWAGAPPGTVEPAGGTGSGGTGSGGTGSGGTSSAGASSGGTSGDSVATAGSGPTIVGGPIAAGGSASANSPTIDPLGLTCTGQCPGSYKCWAATGKPPGICVPECSATQTTCPADYACDTDLGACIQESKPTTTQRSGSCSLSASVGASTGGHDEWWLALGLLGVAYRGRRARRRAGGI